MSNLLGSAMTIQYNTRSGAIALEAIRLLRITLTVDDAAQHHDWLSPVTL